MRSASELDEFNRILANQKLVELARKVDLGVGKKIGRILHFPEGFNMYYRTDYYRTDFAIDIMKRKTPHEYYDHRTAKFASLILRKLCSLASLSLVIPK